MFGFGGAKVRTKQSVRREMNNAAAEMLKNPSKKNRDKVERLRQEYNNWGKNK